MVSPPISPRSAADALPDGDVCEVRFATSAVRVARSQQKVKIEIKRSKADRDCVVRYCTRDVTAQGGLDYQHVAAGLVTLRKGVLSESVVLLLVDSEETAKSRAAKSFEVVIEHVKYGALAPGSGAGVCTVTMGEHLKIKDVTDSQVFQGLSTLFTFWALFGSDIVIVSFPATTDGAFEIVTISCMVFFFVEIVLTCIVKRGKYFNSVIFYMDIIATVALLPSLRAVNYAMSGALSGAGSTGTIARAGRAARAGSRAGRTIKLPRLLGKVAGLVTQFVGPKEEADDDIQARRATTNSGGANQQQSLQEADGTDFRSADLQSQTTRNATSKIGLLMMELFTGKVIVMMMLVLVVSTLLETTVDASQKRMGLDTLRAVYDSVDGDMERPAFMAALAVFTRGARIAGEYNKEEELLYLKIDNQVVRRLKDPEATTLEYEEAPGTVYDFPQDYDDLREIEMSFAGNDLCNNELGKGVETSLEKCTDAVIFDNSNTVHLQAIYNMILTVCIVIILCFGMGLVAMDMQSILMDPIERLATVFRAVASVFIDSTVKEAKPRRSSGTGAGKPANEKHKQSRMSKLFSLKTGDPLSTDTVREPAQNVVRTADLKWKTAISKVEQLEKAFPPEEPLNLVVAAIQDVEQAFSISLKKQRQFVVTMESDISKRYVAIRRIFFGLDEGTLTLTMLMDHLHAATHGVLDMLPTVVTSHPKFIEFSKLYLQIASTVLAGVIHLTESFLSKQVRSMGVQLDSPSQLTSGMMYEYGRSQAQLLLKVLCAVRNKAIPQQVGAMPVSELLDEVNLFAQQALRSGVRAIGMSVPEEVFSGDLVQTKRRVEKLLVEQVLARVPAGISKLMPAEVTEANTLFEFKARVELWMKTTMFDVLKQGMSLKKAVSDYSLHEYFAMAREFVVEKLGGMFPALKRCTDALRAIQGLKEAVRVKAADVPAKLRELSALGYPAVVEQYLPFTVGSLPSLEALQADPKRVGEELLATIRKADVVGTLQREAEAAFKQAVVVLKQLRTSLEQFANPETLTNMDPSVLKAMMLAFVERHGDTLRSLTGSLPSVEAVRAMDLSQAKKTMIETVTPLLTRLKADVDMLPLELLEGKMQEALDLAGKLQRMVNAGMNQLQTFLTTVLGDQLCAIISMLSPNHSRESLAEMSLYEKLMLFVNLLVDSVKASAASLRDQVGELDLGNTMQALKGKAAEAVTYTQAQASALVSSLQEMKAMPLDQLREQAQAAASELAQRLAALDVGKTTGSFVDAAAKMGREMQEQMAAASQSSVDVIMNQAKEMSQHAQQVLLRTMHDAGVSNMQELRAKLQELEAAAGGVVAATQESVAGKVLELRAVTEGLRLHEELVRRMHELTSLAWCKAATATDGVRKRVDSRTSIDATIATELVLQRVETFKAEMFEALQGMQAAPSLSASELSSKAAALMAQSANLLGNAKAVGSQFGLKIQEAAISFMGSATAAAGHVSRSIAESGLPATAMALFAAIFKRDWEQVRILLSELWRAALELLQVPKKMFLEKAMAMVQKMDLNISLPSLEDVKSSGSDLMGVMRSLEGAVKSKLAAMMDASGLPLSDLLNRQSLPELLAAVKEVVTGRMGHVAIKLREGAALVGGSVAGVDAAAAQRALTEAARGLLSKLPPMPTLEQMHPSEVLKLLDSAEIRRVLEAHFPKPLQQMLTTLRDKAAAMAEALAEDERVQAVRGQVERAAGDERVQALKRYVLGVVKYVKMLCMSMLEDGQAQVHKARQLLTQIPLPGQEWKDLTSAKIAELVKLLQEVPGLAENLKHKLPDISFETQLLSTEDITKIAETLSQNRAALVEAVNAQLQEGVRYFQSIGFSQFSLPMDALAQLSNLPSVASIKDMTKDQILQVVQQLGDVEELQRKLGLAVLVTNQTLQEAPHRFGELLAHLSHTDIVLKAKAALAQVPQATLATLAWLRKAASTAGGLDSIPVAELREKLTSIGYPHLLESLTGRAGLPSLEDLLQNRAQLAAELKSISFGVVAGKVDELVAKMKAQVDKLREMVSATPLLNVFQTLMAMQGSIEGAVRGMLSGAGLVSPGANGDGEGGTGGGVVPFSFTLPFMMEKLVEMLKHNLSSDTVQAAFKQMFAHGSMGVMMEAIDRVQQVLRRHTEEFKNSSGVHRINRTISRRNTDMPASSAQCSIDIQEPSGEEIQAEEQHSSKNPILVATNVTPLNKVVPV